jgi:hypothetical protein
MPQSGGAATRRDGAESGNFAVATGSLGAQLHVAIRRPGVGVDVPTNLGKISQSWRAAEPKQDRRLSMQISPREKEDPCGTEESSPSFSP